MNKTELSIDIAFVLSFVAGVFFGWKLSYFQNFHYFKLLNLAGIFLNLLGVLLFSCVVLAKDEIRNYFANQVSRHMVIFSLTIPSSMFVSSFFAMFFGAVSSKDVQIFSSICAVLFSIPAYYIFYSPVFEPVGKDKYESELRVKMLGVTFLGLGFVLQIVAAIGDVLNDA